MSSDARPAPNGELGQPGQSQRAYWVERSPGPDISVAAVNGSPASNDPHAENGAATDHESTKPQDSTHDEESASSTVGHDHVQPDGVVKGGSHASGEHDQTDDEDDSDEEDEEPALKYELLGGDIANVLEGDGASAIAIGAKHMVRAPS